MSVIIKKEAEMPKTNIDELTEKVFEPIEFTLDGKDYKITTLPSEALDTIMDATDNPGKIRNSFAKLIGGDEKEFKKTDFRKLVAAAGFIMSAVREQIRLYQSKNVQGESVVPKQ